MGKEQQSKELDAHPHASPRGIRQACQKHANANMPFLQPHSAAVWRACLIPEGIACGKMSSKATKMPYRLQKRHLLGAQHMNDERLSEDPQLEPACLEGCSTLRRIGFVVKPATRFAQGTNRGRAAQCVGKGTPCSQGNGEHSK